jgi:MFS family permease
MFAPGLFTGDLIRWIGEPAVMLVGCVLMIVHSVVALSGLGRWHFGAALMLSGVGWNFMFVSGSSLLVAALPDKPQPATEQAIAKADNGERTAAVNGVSTAEPAASTGSARADGQHAARRLQMQGVSEFLVRTISVIAALTSGLLLDASGWNLVHIVGLVPAAMTFGAVCWFALISGSCCRRYTPPASPNDQVASA